MKKYVLGFALNRKWTEVLLIQKKRPVWQEGLLNGIGGHVEKTDLSPAHAMVREFSEEVGIQTEAKFWTQFMTMGDGSSWTCDCFYLLDVDIDMWKKMTDETPEILAVSDLDCSDVMSNLKWIIPMINDNDVIGRVLTVIYPKKEGV